MGSSSSARSATCDKKTMIRRLVSSPNAHNGVNGQRPIPSCRMTCPKLPVQGHFRCNFGNCFTTCTAYPLFSGNPVAMVRTLRMNIRQHVPTFWKKRRLSLCGNRHTYSWSKKPNQSKSLRLLYCLDGWHLALQHHPAHPRSCSCTGSVEHPRFSSLSEPAAPVVGCGPEYKCVLVPERHLRSLNTMKPAWSSQSCDNELQDTDKRCSQSFSNDS